MAGYSVTYTVVDEATAKIEAINRRMRQMREPMERQARAIRQFVDVSGLNKVADGFKSIARSTLGAFELMSRLVPVMGALTGAASIAGIVKLTDSFAKFGNQLKVSADRIGITPQTLQTFQDATINAGGSVDDMTESLKELADASAAALTGRDETKMAWFNRAGIQNLKDANGHLKTATQLLPDILKYLDSIKNPSDRMVAAMGLGGEALFKLDELFRTSGKSVNQWVEDAKKLTPLSNEQLTIFQRYKEAQGNITTAVQHLGEQISATLATHFTPLINHLAEFVNKHSPEIIAAVDRIAKKFDDWLKNISWEDVEKGVNKVVEVLKFITNHLDAIKTAAEIFFGLWVASKFAPIIKNFTDLVGSIASVHSKLRETPDATKAATSAFGDLGTIGGGKADSGGSGLLGKLASMVNVIGLAKLGLEQWHEQVGKPIEWGGVPENSPLRQHLSEAGKQAAANAPPEAAKPFSLGSPSTWGGQHGYLDKAKQWLGLQAKPTAATTPTQQEFIDKARPLAEKVSAQTGIHPDIVLAQAALELNWGKSAPNQNYFGIKGPGGTQTTQEYVPGKGMVTQQASFAGYGSMEELFAGYSKFMQGQRYQGVRGGATKEEQLAALAGSGYATDPRYGEKLGGIMSKLPQSTGAPLQVTGGAPVSGAVDITVTHKNPPPGATVTAAGTGDVNVAAPRTEQQAFSFTS